MSASAPEPPPSLLSVRDLAVDYPSDRGVVRAVAGVSFDVPAGRTVALAGESGCGKTSVALAILRLFRPGSGARVSGRTLFRGQDLTSLPEARMRLVRGGKIGMIFQDPLAALNPVLTIGDQIAEAARIHAPMSRGEARARALEMLGRVGLPGAQERLGAYPHELSGGMRQRALIAMALVASPALLVADEPTSALDATVQVQILDLLASLQKTLGMGLLLIAHDLTLLAEIADDIVVLYAGVVVESGPARELLASPRHPYTRALVRSIPPASSFRPRRGAERGRLPLLPVIEGAPPDLSRPLKGCRFFERCDDRMKRCAEEAPPLYEDAAGGVRCFLYEPASGEPRGAE